MLTARNALQAMNADRKAALAAGLFYIGTFAFSIPALALYGDAITDPNWVLSTGGGTGVLVGALFEILTGLTGIGTAVAIYPILRRHGAGRAAGFVASRTIEAATITAGVLAILAVYTMRQDLTGGDPTALTTMAGSLVAVRDWSFLFGPGIMPAINALCFATILRRSGLVPRWIPTLGLIGAPLLVASSMATLFGAFDQVTTISLLLALPIASWELSVAIYMTIKGFRTPAESSTDVDLQAMAPAALAQA